eukprot:IDg1440t1
MLYRLTDALVPPMPLLSLSLRDAHMIEARHETKRAFLFQQSIP